MSYADELREHARIAILRMLEGAPRYTSNASILTDLLPGLGISYTRDQVEGQIRWLEEQGLITVVDHAGFLVATSTVRGVEIAQGIASHPGVQRPRPGV